MTPIRPHKPASPDAAALLRFVSGQSPLPEAEAIRGWIASDPDRQASIDELRAAWQSTPVAAPAWDREGVWAKLSSELAGSTSEASPETSRRHTTRRFAYPSIVPRRWTSPVAKAAAILVLAGAGGALALRPWRAEPAAMREITTTHGQRTVLDLADGSRVTLDAASRLRVPTDLGVAPRRMLFWRKSPRRLELSGRALFDVKHDDARPFIVETATATTQDVGTSFVIAAYPEARATEVAVVDGSVALWDRPSASPESAKPTGDAKPFPTPPLMLLSAGDVGMLDTNGTATRRRGVALESYVSWTRGVLTFDEAPLRDVVAQLGRWYDLDIRLADSALGDRRLTAEVRTETASEALRRIGLTLDLKVELHGRTAVLSLRTSPVARHATER